MQRATTLIRTAAPLRSFATHAARQQLARPQTAGPLAFAARSRGALWVQQTSTQQLQKLHRNSRSLVNDAGAFKNNKDVSYDELKPLTKQPTDVSPVKADLCHAEKQADILYRAGQDVILIGT
jgi:hypothetical protein